jgi:predicted Rossmann-fold nucleotide-binding protein
MDEVNVATGILRKRCIVGVIGGDESVQVEAARQVGEEIAKASQIILTGGMPLDSNEVKNAALWGAHQAERRSRWFTSVRARMIGILKSKQVEWDTAHPCRLFLKTGLTSFERDAINGLTPDVLIVFQGGRGTLCELAYAVAASKPIRYYKSVAQLRRKTEQHLADGLLNRVLEEALGKYPTVMGKTVSSADLIRELGRALDAATPDDLSPAKTVRDAVAEVFRNRVALGQTGFPGLGGEVQRFETTVKQISDCEKNP